MSDTKQPAEEIVQMRFAKPIKFDTAIKTELIASNNERREKNESMQDQANLMIDLCYEAIEARQKKR